jgi:tRNA-splicing ligase RtcB
MNERQANPYETRARELCLIDGLDPDERVPMGDKGRTMMRWCLYQESARQEFKQHEAEKFVAPPQEEKYQNAPLLVYGEHEENTRLQMQNCMKVGNVVSGVLCADGHLGYAQPVGGVIAYEDQISISGVGYDIGCGCGAIQLDIEYRDIMHDIPGLIEKITQHISFGVGRTNHEPVESALFDDTERWRQADRMDYKSKAMSQLGTVGSGNHYVDLLIDKTPLDDPEFGGSIEDCRIWIGVHFGSRGLGHSSATKYLKAAGGKDGIWETPTVVNVASELGQRYISAMTLAGDYAREGRRWVLSRVKQIIGGEELDYVENHHNYAWQEEHEGKMLWVVRKGATPAFPNQRGFVGGSMGDDAVIVHGVENDRAAKGLYSTVHGAGRLFGRKEAKRRFSNEEWHKWLTARNVTIHGGDLDESPMAYRRLPSVLGHHYGTIEIERTLHPFAVAMAGRGEFDPFKD